MKCPFCDSSDIVSAGYRQNKKGKKKIMRCKRCGKKFTANRKFLKMRFKNAYIIKAVKLHQTKSLAETADQLESEFGVRVSRWTISKWSKKFKSQDF